MVLCKWCGLRPAREAEIKWGHYRCSPCRMERHRAGRKKWNRTYAAKHLEQKADWQRAKNKRIVKVAGRAIAFPTIELKQAAAELIRRKRDEFAETRRSQDGAGA